MEQMMTRQFLDALRAAVTQGTFVRLVLGTYRGDEVALIRTTVRKVALRGQDYLSFLHHYRTRDITRNVPVVAGLATIETALGKDFMTAHLLLTNEELHLDLSTPGKGKLTSGKPAQGPSIPAEHDREKVRHLDPGRPFLQALGIADARQRIVPAMFHKWKQIDKFIEIFGHAIAVSELSKRKVVRLVDFGSGKGYLTFAMHDYLRNSLGIQADVTGVELRDELVCFCNEAATRLNCEGLDFRQGTLDSYTPQTVDALVALHACDTATDLALHMGIRAGAEVILCAPCCHKQIRPQLQAPAVLRPLLRFGVHRTQEADMVTDGLRALLLEGAGYRVGVFEFISSDHTSKNKMIAGVRRAARVDRAVIQAQIEAIKDFYGIREHRLETLLKADAL